MRHVFLCGTFLLFLTVYTLGPYIKHMSQTLDNAEYKSADLGQTTVACLVCLVKGDPLSYTNVCSVNGCQEICALCEDCVNMFTGLEECVEAYPFCVHHHPLPIVIQTPPQCVVPYCTVRADVHEGRVEYICERRSHPCQIRTLRISDQYHREMQTRLWVEVQIYLDGTIAVCHPVGSTTQTSVHAHGGKKRKRYTTSEAAIEESVTLQSRSWDNEEYEVATLTKASRLRILAYLLSVTNMTRVQRVVQTWGWFEGWSGTEQLQIAPTKTLSCVGCRVGTVTSAHTLLGARLHLCTAKACHDFVIDLTTCVELECAITSATGVALEQHTRPPYATSWGKQSLARRCCLPRNT
jgi:hypothetical protein